MIKLRRLDLEVTTRCQLECKYCARTIYKRRKSFSPREMPRNLLGKVFNDFKAVPLADNFYSTLNVFGEFFLYKDRRWLCEKLYEHGVLFTFGSNGVSLDFELLQNYPPNCREDIFTVTVYEGNRFSELAKKNVLTLITGYGFKDFYCRSAYGRDETFFSTVRNLGVPDLELEFHNWTGELEFPGLELPAPKGKCFRFQGGMWLSVCVDGSVTICNRDFGTYLGRVGNLYGQSLKDILNGPELEHWRRLYHDNRLYTTRLCQSCEYNGKAVPILTLEGEEIKQTIRIEDENGGW